MPEVDQKEFSFQALISVIFLFRSRDMVSLEFTEDGRVSGLPPELPPQNSIEFEIVTKEVDIIDADAMSLKLALEAPVEIAEGTWTLTFGGNSFAISASEVTAYSLETCLNRLASIVSAGGVDVAGDRGIYTLTFRDVSARSALTVSHSSLGAETGRCSEVTAGSGSVRAVFQLDFTVQILAAVTASINIVDAEVTVANIVTGTVSLSQRDAITISRQPYRGKWLIKISAGNSTEWLQPDASAYKVQTALDSVSPDVFLVSSEQRGKSTVFDVRRKAAGVQSAVTVVDTFIGPIGVTMTLNASKVRQLLQITRAKADTAYLIYEHKGQVRFSQPVRLSPTLMAHGQPI
jgi:hypothetical protein